MASVAEIARWIKLAASAARLPRLKMAAAGAKHLLDSFFSCLGFPSRVLVAFINVSLLLWYGPSLANELRRISPRLMNQSLVCRPWSASPTPLRFVRSSPRASVQYAPLLSKPIGQQLNLGAADWLILFHYCPGTHLSDMT